MHQFCADTSRSNNESFLGTASPVRYWLMIECPGVWTGNALQESTIPQSVKAFLRGLYEKNLDIRIQLIQKTALENKTITLFWASSDPTDSKLWKGELAEYEDLLTIDFTRLVLQGVTNDFQQVADAHFFICTNGQHDPCCSKYGATLFQATSKFNENIWQTTHLGGDRFAANVLCLPYGIYYRRVDQIALEAMIIAHDKAQIYLPTFAGRSWYPRELQVAECFIRAQSGILDLTALQFLDSSGNEDQATATFIDMQHAKHHVEILREIDTITARLSCHADRAERLRHYRLVKYWTST